MCLVAEQLCCLASRVHHTPRCCADRHVHSCIVVACSVLSRVAAYRGIMAAEAQGAVWPANRRLLQPVLAHRLLLWRLRNSSVCECSMQRCCNGFVVEAAAPPLVLDVACYRHGAACLHWCCSCLFPALLLVVVLPCKRLFCSACLFFRFMLLCVLCHSHTA